MAETSETWSKYVQILYDARSFPSECHQKSPWDIPIISSLLVGLWWAYYGLLVPAHDSAVQEPVVARFLGWRDKVGRTQPTKMLLR